LGKRPYHHGENANTFVWSQQYQQIASIIIVASQANKGCKKAAI